MITVQSPRGKSVVIHDRENTCDLSIIGGTFYLWGKTDDEYGLTDLHPKTFLDIGGHIGVVTLAVLVDNPECRAVILEPLPENIEAIERNLTENGVADRALIVPGAISTERLQRVGYQLPRVPNAPETDYYVGGSVDDAFEGDTITVVGYRLDELINLTAGYEGMVDLAKIDCEGCEYTLFEQDGVERVERWVGEYHPGGNLGTLQLTHDVKTMPHGQGGTGNFVAVRR